MSFSAALPQDCGRLNKRARDRVGLRTAPIRRPANRRRTRASALNVHFHMLFLDGLFIEHPDGALRFRWVKAPTSTELASLTQTLARRIGHYLERQGLLERDAENSYLAGDRLEAGAMEQHLGSSITYRIAVGPQQGWKVSTLQTLPACDEPFDDGVGKVAG